MVQKFSVSKEGYRVQQEGKACRERSQRPVAWMTGVRETKHLKLIDKAASRSGERVTGPQRK